MEKVKTWFGAFVVGGVYAVIGQIIIALLSAVLGPDFMFLGHLALLLVGIVGFLLYVTGIHQKLASFSGYGSNLPLNGFAAAIADVFGGTYEESGSFGAGVVSALKLLGLVVGVGGGIAVALGAILFFIG